MFRTMHGKFANIEKLSDEILNHEIFVMESRARQWARVWQTSALKYLGPRYSMLIIEKEFRNV
jgi:hypothetical protein